MKRNKAVLCVLLCLMALVPGLLAHSEETEEGDWYFSFFPTGFFKVEAEVGYKGIRISEGVDTSLYTAIEGGYEGVAYYKDATTVPLVPVLDETEFSKTQLSRVPLAWKAGIKQGFAWNDRLESNLVEGYLFYRGRYEKCLAGETTPNLFNTGLPDAEQGFQTSFVAGVSLNDVYVSSHQVWDGIFGDISYEYAPKFLNVYADYSRVHAEFSVFLPVLDLRPDRRLNLFSIYVGNRISTSYEFGAYRTVTGRLQNEFDVRGVEIERFDSRLIAFDNFDIRINLPAFFHEGILPTATLYFDSGYHWESADYNGFLFSLGAGLGLNLFSYALFGIRMDYSINDSMLNGNQLSFAFNYRFQF